MAVNTTELTKLQSALFTMIASNVSGKAQEAFWARENLRSAADFANDHLAPTSDDALELTGIEEFYRESVQEAYRVLGAPIPHSVALSMAH